jgi:prepilin-type N-terminal cleavage/methylation domain-containing protein
VRRPHQAAGYTILELAVVISIAAVLLSLAFTSRRGHTDQQRLRYGTVQVATDLRQAQERAKGAGRIAYTVTFTASSPTHIIARSGGGFSENARLPRGVTVTANAVVTFSAFGRPDCARTSTIQSALGAGTATV